MDGISIRADRLYLTERPGGDYHPLEYELDFASYKHGFSHLPSSGGCIKSG